MAIYRQIHISFWQDNFVLSLTPEEKYFYLYLMTNSKTSQCGVYEIKYSVMILETGYNHETISKLISKFIKHGKIEYCKKTEEIFLINWLKYNSCRSPQVQKRVREEVKAIKSDDFRKKFNRLWIDYTETIHTELQPEPEPEPEPEEEKNQIPLLLNSWNSFAEMLNLNQVIKLTEKRILWVRQRLKEKEFDLDLIFENIRQSKFLLGDNDRGWKVDFDFIFGNKNNYIKILEGKYDDKNKKGIEEKKQSYNSPIMKELYGI